MIHVPLFIPWEDKSDGMIPPFHENELSFPINAPEVKSFDAKSKNLVAAITSNQGLNIMLNQRFRRRTQMNAKSNLRFSA